MKGIIFDIAPYSIYDGPGIRTNVYLKGCPLHCLWCQNPESQKFSPELSYSFDKCIKCGTCASLCPKNAMTLNSEDGIWIDRKKCTLCGICVEKCPQNALEVIGREVTVEDLLKEIMRDKEFFNQSGGGVTITGGEPTAQPQFLLEFLTQLKENKIHTAIETCGAFSEILIPDLIERVDLFLFDIKHPVTEIHKELTGVPNEQILNNFKKIHEIVGSNRIIPRIPLIPRINTDLEIIEKIITFLLSIDYSRPVHLMPYNKMTKSKYQKIGKPEFYQDMGELSESSLNAILSLFSTYKFGVVVNE